jgi:signal peptidase II
MPLPIFFTLAVAVFGLDQATKEWALRSLSPYRSVPLVPGFFQLTLTTNTGAAFGMMPAATPLLAVVALAAAIGIVTYILRQKSRLPLAMGFALALPLGGALGNFTDRAWRHFVVDFFDAYIGTHHWPIFNVADSAICVGVGILVVTLLKSGDGAEAPPPVAVGKDAAPEPSAGSSK